MKRFKEVILHNPSINVNTLKVLIQNKYDEVSGEITVRNAIKIVLRDKEEELKSEKRNNIREGLEMSFSIGSRRVSNFCINLY